MANTQAQNAAKATPSRETLLDIFRRMALIKQNDERFRQVIRTGRLIMPYYSTRGQEVIPACMSVNLRNDDYVCTIYRGIHDSLAKGVPVKYVWAELAGKATGTCKGKGGPMHITHPASGVMVTTGIVGSSMPIANGLAWAAQLRGESRVAVANFGDGAANIGSFHEALNLAGAWKLPVVFVCQNNRYGEHTKYEVTTPVDQIAKRAASYGMPGIHVDGNEPLAMYAAAKEAIDRARSGGGPTLIEAMTFRFHGHIMGDMDEYMPAGEKQGWIDKDPFPKYRAWLISQGHATEEALAATEAKIEKEIDEALEFALSSPEPEAIELRRDVFAQELAV
ncbi:MAG TPA: thiamine pyrophosphate-dependent dehydrogenase E1 component subunit alpha [Steroidobacteraceae bacterium]|nr:thiamine pyrophosphate-dependent dehydrogenase E1 component subunit alpha [Steroidobacteraceae bacterium]